MKLDHDLIRKLLIAVEYISNGSTNFHISDIQKDQLRDYDFDVIHYHVKQLSEGGIIYSPRSSSEHVIDLTFQGHQYLANIRCEKTWSKTKECIKPFGTLAIDVVSDIAKNIILGSLNMLP